MSKEEMQYFKEKKKNQYLNTLLKNLNASLKKLDKEYGDDKMEKMTRALARKKQTQVQEREKKISAEIMNSMNRVKSQKPAALWSKTLRRLCKLCNLTRT